MWNPCPDCAERNRRKNEQRIKAGKKPYGPGPTMFKATVQSNQCYMHWLDRQLKTA